MLTAEGGCQQGDKSLQVKVPVSLWVSKTLYELVYWNGIDIHSQAKTECKQALQVHSSLSAPINLPSKGKQINLVLTSGIP
jgi:hypothetical protein